MATTRKTSPDFCVTSDDFENIYGCPIAEALDDEEAFKAYSEGMTTLRQDLADVQNFCDKITSHPEVAAKMWMRVIRVLHRTLQANVIRFLAALLKEYAKTEYYDARNEGAVEFAKKVTALKDVYIPYI